MDLITFGQYQPDLVRQLSEKHLEATKTAIEIIRSGKHEDGGCVGTVTVEGVTYRSSLEVMPEIKYENEKNKHEWLIWSEEHRAWWKPQWNGYTPNREDAGRYTFEEACNIVKSANILKNDVPNEAMIRYEV